MTIRIAEDRSMVVQPHQTVRTAWVGIDILKLGSRVPLSPEAVADKVRRLVNIGPDAAPWPPIVGHWDHNDGRFAVDDGRHEYVAALITGRTTILVAWLETDQAGAGARSMQATKADGSLSG